MQHSVMTAKTGLQERLAPYTAFFAKKDTKPGQMGLIVVDVPFIACTLLLWALSTYVKAFVEEIAKKHAQEFVGGEDDTLQNLEERIDKLAAQIQSRATDMPVAKGSPSEADLIQWLKGRGLSETTAASAARDLLPEIEKAISVVAKGKC